MDIAKIFKQNKFLILAFLITILIALTLFPRTAELVSNNYVFVQDQGRDYIEVKNLVENKKLTLIGSEIGGGYAGINGIFQGPVHFWLLSIFYIIFKGDPIGGILYMTLFGFSAVIASFFLGKKLFSNNFSGIILALLIASSPPLIAQSRFVWNPYPSTLFIILSFYFIYRMHDKKFLNIFLASFFAAFIYNFELAITAPLLISIISYSIFILKFRNLKNYIAFFMGSFIAFIPMILFEVRHNFLGINGLIKYINTPTDPTSSYGFINNHISRFIFNLTDTFPTQNIIPGLILATIFGLLAFYYYKKEKKSELKKYLIFLLILIIISVIIFSFLRNHIFMYYLYHLNVVYIIVATYIFHSSWLQKNKIPAYFFTFILTVTILLALQSGIKIFRADVKDYGGSSKMISRKDAVDYIYKDAKGNKFGLFIFTPGVLTHQFDYVFEWYGEKKYGYLPNQDKDKLFYLLIDKDPYSPWSHKGWQETVIKEGKIIETKTLPSGLILEKRCGVNCPIK